MNRLTIRIIRTLRGESQAHMRARIRKHLRSQYERNAMTTHFYQAAGRV